MIKLVAASLMLLALSLPATAAPLVLTDPQMDQVTAGDFFTLTAGSPPFTAVAIGTALGTVTSLSGFVSVVPFSTALCPVCTQSSSMSSASSHSP